MKTKRIISAVLVLTMVLSMPLYAFADITQTVSAGFGEGQEQHITVNDNVTVANEVNAVYVEAHAPSEAEDKSASAEVKGDVTATNEDSFSAVYVEARNGDATARITGKLEASGGNNVNAVETWGHSYNGTGYAYADIGGDVTVSASGHATAIDNDCGDVSVENDVIATGNDVTGVESYEEGNINIGGNIKATGTREVYGVYIYTGEDKQQTVTVGKDITATYTSDNIYWETDAARFEPGSGKTIADFKGNVIASNTAGTATGLCFSASSDEAPSLSSAYFDVKVGNNIISDSYGILKNNGCGSADIIVENEVKAKKAAVLLVDDANLYEQVTDGSAYSANQLNLTAWKLNLNENGNVAELIVDYNEAVAAKDFEKKINYIIKAEQPTEYGTISFVDANGSALKKVNNYFVAHEGDKVVVKPNLKEGYQLKAAYNGTDEKLPLQTDANGNYYIIVPKGGGVSISVEIEKAPEAETEKEPETVSAEKKANPLKIKGKKITLNAAKAAEKAQFISVKKAIKFIKKGKGKISYQKVKGNKKITVNKKTGKITVKKGLKKGTYKITVKVTAKGNSDYKKATKKTVIKIVIA